MFPRLLSVLLVLALLGVCAPAANAQTPTPTLGPSPTPAAQDGYFWVGEAITTPITITAVSPAYTSGAVSYCTAYGGFVVAVINVISGTNGTILATTIQRTAASATLSSLQRVSSGSGKLIYSVVNTWFKVPQSIIDTMILAYASADVNTEVYIDSVYHSPAANHVLRASLVTATTGTINGQNVLCYVPPAPTATPDPSPTPADVVSATLASGAEMHVTRTVSYGDIAIVTASLVGLLFFLLSKFIRIPKLWN